MDYSVLEKSDLFTGVSIAELRSLLKEIPHHFQCCNKGETIMVEIECFHGIGFASTEQKHRI